MTLLNDEASNRKLLRLIAVFKFLKAATLIFTGLATLTLVHSDSWSTLDRWVSHLGFDPGGRVLERAISKIANIPRHRLREIGFGSFLYGGLFLIEGTGLWLRRYWGEWVTVIITGSLVPIEIYELIKRPNAAKAALLVVNLAVVVYLIDRIRRERAQPILQDS